MLVYQEHYEIGSSALLPAAFVNSPRVRFWARVRKRHILPRRIRPHGFGVGEGRQIIRNGLAMLFQL